MFSRIADGFTALAQQSDREDDGDVDREFWSYVCMIVDRIFFIVFFFMFTGSYIKVFSEVPSHYDFPL